METALIYIYDKHTEIKSNIVSLINDDTAWKVSKYGVISGPYFPVFGLNTGI